MRWILWGILLVIQNASFTLVSRARNSRSLWYHGLASTASNGVWFASQYILLGNMLDVMRTASFSGGLKVGIFYVACTMVGSIAMHALAMRFFEKKGVMAG